jgi:hypothetical protein
MSRTKKTSKSPGTEYWKSRLKRQGEVPGRFTKQQTARKERRQDKKVCTVEGGNEAPVS